MNCVIYNFVDHVVVSKLKDCPQHLLQQYFQLISHYEDEDIQPWSDSIENVLPKFATVARNARL